MPCFSAEPLPRLTALASNVVSATCFALRKKGAYSGPLPSSTTTIWDGFAPLNSARRPQRISVGWYAGIRNTIGSSPVIGGLESMKSRFFLTHQGSHRGSKESIAGECGAGDELYPKRRFGNTTAVKLAGVPANSPIYLLWFGIEVEGACCYSSSMSLTRICC